MKSIELKTKEIVEAYTMLGSAKYQKLSDDDKVKVWKISKTLKPIALGYAEEEKDARQSLMPTETFYEDCKRAAEYEKLLLAKQEPTMKQEEYQKIQEQFVQYQTTLAKALKESQERQVTIEFEPISEEAFGKLMASNDWSFEQVGKLEFTLE